jgi:hypothetical protein
MSLTAKRYTGQVAQREGGFRKRRVRAGLEDPPELFLMDDAIRRAGLESKDI